MTGGETGRPLVLGLVGTDHHPFDRLVGWLDALAADRDDVRVLVQYGTSRPPAHAEGVALLPKDGLAALIEEAAVVVSHGGPSTIVEAYRSGLVPVVVPRSPDHGEHVDGHQQRFVRFAEQRGLALVAGSAQELGALVRRGLAGALPRPAQPLPPPDEAAARLARLVERGTARPSWRLRALRARAGRSATGA